MVALAPLLIQQRDLGQVRTGRSTPEIVWLFGPIITSFLSSVTTLPAGLSVPFGPLAG
jgi:hypothetical protein